MTGTVAPRVEEFIALRRGLGYRSPSQERALRAFGRYLDQKGHKGPIPLELSLDWAASTLSSDPRNPARRLTTVRGFLRHLAAAELPVEHRPQAAYRLDRATAELWVRGVRVSPIRVRRDARRRRRRRPGSG